MFVIVVLILSASAIAMPPSGPSSFRSRLQNEGVTKKGMIGMLLPYRCNKNASFKVGVTHANRGNDVGEVPHLMVVIVLLILSASAIAMPHSGPNLLPFRLRNEGGNKIGMIGMLLPSR